jgi:metal-sulfur cluster biosynthetic enzyme
MSEEGREARLALDTLGELHMPAITEQDVLSALKSCYDPEIPVNIVDLGLIYQVRLAPTAENQQDVIIDMTLTAQGCPAHASISAQVKSRLEQLPGIRNATVNIVRTPAWTPDRLSTDAKRQLGIERTGPQTSDPINGLVGLRTEG